MLLILRTLLSFKNPDRERFMKILNFYQERKEDLCKLFQLKFRMLEWIEEKSLFRYIVQKSDLM